MQVGIFFRCSSTTCSRNCFSSSLCVRLSWNSLIRAIARSVGSFTTFIPQTRFFPMGPLSSVCQCCVKAQSNNFSGQSPFRYGFDDIASAISFPVPVGTFGISSSWTASPPETKIAIRSTFCLVSTSIIYKKFSVPVNDEVRCILLKCSFKIVRDFGTVLTSGASYCAEYLAQDREQMKLSDLKCCIDRERLEHHH